MFIHPRTGEALGSVLLSAVPGKKSRKKAEPEPEQQEPEPVPEPEPEPESDPVGSPKAQQSKADWVDYAVSQGVARDEAESMTKQELVEVFGE